MEVKVSMVIMSHLSDAEYETSVGQTELALKRIRFVKYLLLNFSLGDYVEVDELKKMWDQVNIQK